MGFTRVEDTPQNAAQLETSAWVEGREVKVPVVDVTVPVESGPYVEAQEELNSALVIKTVGDLARGLNRTGRAKMMEAIADYVGDSTFLLPENKTVIGVTLRAMASSEARH